MKEVERIALPRHAPDGEFDHAAVDPVGDRLFVAHPSNDSVEMVDLRTRRHLGSLTGLRGVAGVWVDAEAHLLFTSNRGENTSSVFQLGADATRESFRLATGSRPNGMAFDARRGVLMVAGVGDPRVPRSPPTLTFIDVQNRRILGQTEAPGRTRWALYHRASDTFYVNVADPPLIAAIPAGQVPTLERTFPMPARGPHGLEQDPDGGLLYCACDDGVLLSLDLATAEPKVVGRLSGPPDVLWLNARRRRLYCAIGTPGAVDVFGLHPLGKAGSVPTQEGAHTLTVDPQRDQVHVFLPESHEDLVLDDSGD